MTVFVIIQSTLYTLPFLSFSNQLHTWPSCKTFPINIHIKGLKTLINKKKKKIWKLKTKNTIAKTENWKHYSEIIFKYVNSAVESSFKVRFAFFHTCGSCEQCMRSSQKRRRRVVCRYPYPAWIIFYYFCHFITKYAHLEDVGIWNFGGLHE